ncbi:MAG: hypothetical protein WDO72_00530 [Pseudomonadota bacterium]
MDAREFPSGAARIAALVLGLLIALGLWKGYGGLLVDSLVR